MAVTLIPYGQLANSNYGVNIDPATQKPLASVMEVLTTLPPLASVDNFDGRLVFSTNDRTAFVFSSLPVPQWKPLEGIPAQIGNVNGNPPTTPTPQNGELFWDLDTQVLFVWDGGTWQPAGGRYAAQILENTYNANGTQVTFPTGAASAVPVEYVEVHLDGVRQVAGVDYTVVGTLITFTVAPPNGLVIYVRTMVSDAIVQNAQVSSASYTTVGGDTDFSTGKAGADPAGVFVFVDGIIQQGGNVDYLLLQQDTTITSLTKTGPTTGVVTTTLPHNVPVGAPVTLVNFAEPEFNNITYTVQAVPTTTTFEITLLPTDPASGTANPISFFSPPYLNDVVRFTTPRTAGQRIEIRTLRNVVVSGNVGEINTLASSGVGVPLHNTKIGDTLRVKSLLAGPNVDITNIGDEVQITANIGQGFENRVGINAASYAVINTVSYVGVRNTSTPVTIDLTLITQNPNNSGRKVTIKDESGGAGSNSIVVVGGPATIDGVGAPYIINNNYGSVTLVFDGNDWFVTAARP